MRARRYSVDLGEQRAFFDHLDYRTERRTLGELSCLAMLPFFLDAYPMKLLLAPASVETVTAALLLVATSTILSIFALVKVVRALSTLRKVRQHVYLLFVFPLAALVYTVFFVGHIVLTGSPLLR